MRALRSVGYFLIALEIVFLKYCYKLLGFKIAFFNHEALTGHSDKIPALTLFIEQQPQ